MEENSDWLEVLDPYDPPLQAEGSPPLPNKGTYRALEITG